jgi:hypothetical protein
VRVPTLERRSCAWDTTPGGNRSDNLGLKLSAIMSAILAAMNSSDPSEFDCRIPPIGHAIYDPVSVNHPAHITGFDIFFRDASPAEAPREQIEFSKS